MIRTLLSIALVSAAFAAGAQSFSAKYNFAAVTPTTGTTDPTPVPTATGVIFGSFSAVGTGTATSGAGRFSFTGWPTGATNAVDTYSTMTGALDPSKYYEVSITPASGYNVTLTGITWGTRRSGTGVRNAAVRSSQDGYMANLPASVGTNTNLSVVGTDNFFFNSDAITSEQVGSTITLGASFINLTSAVNFRFYGWNAEGTSGTYSIDSVVFAGISSMATGVGSISFDLNSGLNVYPVPNHDGIVYIDNNTADLSKVEVFDMLGNLVTSQDAKSDKKLKLNLSDMPAGSYYLRFTGNNKTATKKIVILK